MIQSEIGSTKKLHGLEPTLNENFTDLRAFLAMLYSYEVTHRPAVPSLGGHSFHFGGYFIVVSFKQLCMRYVGRCGEKVFAGLRASYWFKAPPIDYADLFINLVREFVL